MTNDYWNDDAVPPGRAATARDRQIHELQARAETAEAQRDVAKRRELEIAQRLATAEVELRDAYEHADDAITRTEKAEAERDEWKFAAVQAALELDQLRGAFDEAVPGDVHDAVEAERDELRAKLEKMKVYEEWHARFVVSQSEGRNLYLEQPVDAEAWCTCGAKTPQGQYHKSGCPARKRHGS